MDVAARDGHNTDEHAFTGGLDGGGVGSAPAGELALERDALLVRDVFEQAHDVARIGESRKVDGRRSLVVGHRRPTTSDYMGSSALGPYICGTFAPIGRKYIESCPR